MKYSISYNIINIEDDNFTVEQLNKVLLNNNERYIALTSIHFNSTFNKSLDDVVFPEEIVSISLGDSFDKPIDKTKFPSKLHTINFGNAFDQSLSNVKLPNSVNNIIFGKSYRQSIAYIKLPESLYTFTFNSYDYNILLNATFPSSLKKIIIGEFREYSPEKNIIIPDNFEYVEFGYYFNQSINNVVFPLNIKKIDFGVYFNQPIEHIIFPEELKDIYISNYLRQSLKNLVLPKYFKRLILHDTSYFTNEALLPNNLKELSIYKITIPYANIKFPLALKKLTFNAVNNYNTFLSKDSVSLENLTLPDSLETLVINLNLNQPIDKVKWPLNLKNLDFGYSSESYEYSLDNLPSNLETLSVYEPKLPLNNLPISLEKLNINYDPWPNQYSLDIYYLDEHQITKIPFGCKIYYNGISSEDDKHFNYEGY